jgi:anti-anti-sigma factor
MAQPHTSARVAAAEVAPASFVVRASGLFDDETPVRLRGALHRVAGSGGSRVLLDLRGATGIDSVSVAIIASAARTSRTNGEDLSVITSDPTLSARLDASGAAGLVHFEESVRQWLAQ